MKLDKNPLQELRDQQKKERKTMKAELALIAALPDGFGKPCISNLNFKRDSDPYAWLSWSIPYEKRDHGKEWALSLFKALEANGAEPVPATLCKWDNYRPYVSFGLQSSIPAERPDWGQRTKKLTDSWPIAPLWVEPEQHTSHEAQCFYRIAGHICKVGIDIPLPVHLSCRRVDFVGGWRFDGPCSVVFPPQWHDIHNANGETVAQLDKNTRGFHDTDQGISGQIFWSPVVDHKDFPMTPAQFLEAIINEKTK